ncbi:MAG: alkaline phosphatase [Propionibacteriales bacterium]|nr:alkaline phosphatase [Propionibacteriales bacterium]
MNRPASLAVGLVTVPVLLASSAGGVPADSTRGVLATSSSDPLVSVAGDIACGTKVPAYDGGAGTLTECRQRYTSRLILDSDAVWTLGDHVYPTASLEQFRAVYRPTWGRMKAVTFPTPGDHDYGKTAGKGYFSYFDRRPYYTFAMGGWRVLSLNSEINHSANSAQVRWLRRKLASTNAHCIAAYFSTPRWTSGPRAPGDASFNPFWKALYAAHADLVIGGDTHNYERFAKQTPTGAHAADGIRQFVVGSGGRNLYGFPHVQPHSQVRKMSFGVLQLRLHRNAYGWRFVNQAKRVLDSGSKTCN